MVNCRPSGPTRLQLAQLFQNLLGNAHEVPQ